MFNIVLLDGMDHPEAATNWMAGSEMPVGWEGRIAAFIKEEQLVTFSKDKHVSLDCDIIPCEGPEEAGVAAGAIMNELTELTGVKVLLVTFNDDGRAQLATPQSGSWLSAVAIFIKQLRGGDESLATQAPASLKQLFRKSSTSQSVTVIKKKVHPIAKPGIITQCYRCGITLWNDDDRTDHHNASQRCDICTDPPRLFCSRRSLTAHQRNCHPTCRDNECDCGQSFQHPWQLNQHLIDFDKPVSCTTCSARFHTARAAISHDCDPLNVSIRTRGGDLLYAVCRNCGMLYQNQHNMCSNTLAAHQPAPVDSSSEYTSGTSITAVTTNLETNVGRNPP
eukprot:TRINITY_DN30947_c0_g1_i1.p1 TRINITY_DN30947_c0_g1~~TRINITY_DN30947_c0_g1_i1.p1  ORF type:complete len:336 (+),score=49.78 TRINITY_DN30947_c0_g1_i1:90-1097(+)